VDPYGFGKEPKAAKPAHHGGGGVFHSISHFVSDKAGRAAHDIAGIPGGTYAVVKSALPTKEEIEHPLRFNTKSAKRQWGGFLTHPIREQHHAARGDYGKEAQSSAAAVGGLIGGTKTALRHPLRDPFMTALTVLPATAAAGRVGEAAIGAKGARVLRVGEERTPVNLLASKNAGARLAQRGYDRMLQRALDREASGQKVGRVGGRVAKHATKRVAGAQAEEQRIEQKLRLIPADMLDRSAAKILRKRSTGRDEQAALELTSTQTPPEAAAAYHYAQARKGVNPKRNMELGKIYERVATRNLVHVDLSREAGAKVHINPAHERLAHVDEQLARVQRRGDTILAEHGVMTPEELQARVDAPGRIRAGATYEKPTPGKAGVPSASLEFRRAEANRLQAASDRAQGRVQRMRFTAADKKRIGNMSTPVDAATLREQLRPLDKQLRQLTEEWNAPAKQGGQMTEAEAEARSRRARQEVPVDAHEAGPRGVPVHPGDEHLRQDVQPRAAAPEHDGRQGRQVREDEVGQAGGARARRGQAPRHDREASRASGCPPGGGADARAAAARRHPDSARRRRHHGRAAEAVAVDGRDLTLRGASAASPDSQEGHIGGEGGTGDRTDGARPERSQGAGREPD
jgi:hypothetical protein